MGTRADFYIGKGPLMQWVGYRPMDGYIYREDKNNALIYATTEEKFRELVYTDKNIRGPHTGDPWPWPWKDSLTTDYAYVFCDGRVEVYCFGRGPLPPYEPDEEYDIKSIERVSFFRNMRPEDQTPEALPPDPNMRLRACNEYLETQIARLSADIQGTIESLEKSIVEAVALGRQPAYDWSFKARILRRIHCQLRDLT